MRFASFAAGLKDVLKTQSSRSGSFRAPTDIGCAREFFCCEFLSQFLPESVAVTSGEVIDSYGHQTGQMDVVLYNRDLFAYRVTPKLQLLLAEGCFAVIEVKSSLDKREFFDCLAKCSRFKSLKLSLRPQLPPHAHLWGRGPMCHSFDNSAEPVMARWEHEICRFIKPRFYVFSYGGPKDIGLLKEWLVEYFTVRPWREDDTLPDLICVLDVGVAYLDDGFAFALRTDGERLRPPSAKFDPAHLPYQFVNSNCGEVAAFAFHVLEAVNTSKKESRLDAMGMSIHLRKYFDLALDLEANINNSNSAVKPDHG